MTDWRALCGELADTLERAQRALRFEGGCSDTTDNKRRALIARVRAALAEEPVATPAGPSDDDLDLLVIAIQALRPAPDYSRHDLEVVDKGREILRKWLARFGHQPAPPAEGDDADEARYLATELRDQADDLSPSLELFCLIHRAADLLERLASPACVVLKPSPELIEAFKDALPGRIEPLPDGAQVIEPAERTILVPARTPVPVSERLPGPGDCDEKGSCWLWSADDVDGVGHWSYSHRDWAQEGDVTHWLPAIALPLPLEEGHHD